MSSFTDAVSTTTRSAEEVFEDHLGLRTTGSLEEDLRRNYAEDVVLLTVNSNARGHDAIRMSAQRLREQLPNARYEFVAKRVNGPYVLLIWRAGRRASMRPRELTALSSGTASSSSSRSTTDWRIQARQAHPPPEREDARGGILPDPLQMMWTLKEARMDMPRLVADAILSAAADAVVATDHDGMIRVWNPGAERIFGHRADEAMGQSLNLIIPERLRLRHWEGFHRVMATGESHYGAGDLLSVPGLRKDGQQISLEFTIVPLKDEQGRMWGLAAVMRDVTSRFEEIRGLKKKLTEATAPASPH